LNEKRGVVTVFRHNRFTQEQFDSICLHARAKNKDALMGDLKTYGTLDVCLNGYTPAVWLAKEGNESAVWFLVHNYYVNLKHVAYGAAAGKQFNIVQQAMDFFDAPGFKASIAASAAGGAARGGHFKEMYQYIGHDHNALEPAIQEAARAGHFDVVYRLIELGLKGLVINGGAIIFSHDLMLSIAVYGAALGGHFEFMRFLLKYISKDPLVLNKAAEGAAEVGNVQETNELIEQGADISFVAKGAGRGDQIDMIRALNLFLIGEVVANLPMKDVLAGAMEGGHFGLVKELMDCNVANLTDVLKFAGKNGHIHIINHLVDYYKPLPMSGILQATSEAVAQSGHIYHPDMALRFISLIQNETLRMLLATDFLDAHYLPSDDITYDPNCSDEYKSFREKVRKINSRINQYDLNFDEAHALVFAEEKQRVFILQAYQLVTDEKMLLEIYLACAQHVLGIPDETAAGRVINAMHDIRDQYITDQNDLYFFKRPKPPVTTSEPMKIEPDNDWNNIGCSG
jgi:hypothetical protein